MCGGRHWPTAHVGHGAYYSVSCGEEPYPGRFVFIIVRRREYLQLCGVSVFGPSLLQGAKMKEVTIQDHPHVDGACNIQFIDTTMQFTRDGYVRSFEFYAKRGGIGKKHTLQVDLSPVHRPTPHHPHCPVFPRPVLEAAAPLLAPPLFLCDSQTSTPCRSGARQEYRMGARNRTGTPSLPK